MKKQQTLASELFTAARKGLELTQAEMAALLQIDRSYLSRIENDKAEPSLKLLRHVKGVAREGGLLGYGDCDEENATRSAHFHLNAEKPVGEHSALRVEETLQKYRGAADARGVTHSPLILDPKWQSERERPAATTIEDVLDYLEPWLAAGLRDPDVPPVMLHILKKHLPHSDLPEEP